MAAGATYEPIATTTLGSAAASITFSSIPATYTDLRCVLTGKASTGSNLYLQFNGVTSGYSSTQMYGNGTTAASARTASTTKFNFCYGSAVGINPTQPSMFEIDIFSYAGSTYKTLLETASTDSNGSGSTEKLVGLWQNTAAVTSMVFSLDSTYTFSVGTTATLYGIKAA